MHLPSKIGYKRCGKEFTGDTMGTCTETQEHTKSPSSPTAAPLGELEVGEGAKPELHLWMWATLGILWEGGQDRARTPPPLEVLLGQTSCAAPKP